MGNPAFAETGWDAKEMFPSGKGNCYSFTAIFWALSRNMGYETRAISGTISVTQSQIDELFQVTGSLPKVDDRSPIYIVSDGAVYEAFCQGETGFGIYLPGQAQYALCRADGEYVMYEIQ